MSVVVSAVRGPGRGWSYLFTATTLSPDATTVPNWDYFCRSGCKLFAGQKMRAATGVDKNAAHGCTEIDTLLQVATLCCLTDAVRIVETALVEGFDDDRHWPTVQTNRHRLPGRERKIPNRPRTGQCERVLGHAVTSAPRGDPRDFQSG